MGLPRAYLAERNDAYMTREVRDPLDKLIAWGVTFLAIVLAVGYKLLPRLDASTSFARRRGRRPPMSENRIALRLLLLHDGEAAQTRRTTS